MKPRIIRRCGKWQVRPMPKSEFRLSGFVNCMVAVNFCFWLNNREAA
jgi:hypothetical protein